MMIKFSEFRKVLEEALVESEVLTHLYHNEELVINDGRKGFNNAMGNLYAVHNALTGGKKSSRVRITEKLDGCLAGDTLVVCKDGVKPISEITHEDEVKCFDVDTGETVYHTGMYLPPGDNSKKWVELTFEDYSTIKCTDDHLFLTNTGFVEANKLTDNLLANKRVIKIVGIETQIAYDLSSPTEAFYIKVGDNEIVTHNSPSLVFGYHPVNKKFFVATKSAFNKDPKINYTNKDIDMNHGHAAGLVAKLKLALEYLPKVAPKSGVYQCDVMFSKEDVKSSQEGLTFKPNTITYTIQLNHPDYDHAKSAKFAVAVHTKYTGQPTSDYHINGMSAGFNVDYQNFGKHRDVLLISPLMGTQPEYTRTQQELVKQSLKLARELNRKVTDKDYDATGLHDDHMRLYFNAKVRDGGKPSIGDYFNFIKSKLEKEVEKMKSPAGQTKKQEVLDMFIAHFNNNRASFDKVFAIHGYIQKAKDDIVKTLSSKQSMKTQVDGKDVKPEGFVVIKDGRPTKLVDRAEFSRLNFQNNRGRV